MDSRMLTLALGLEKQKGEGSVPRSSQAPLHALSRKPGDHDPVAVSGRAATGACNHLQLAPTSADAARSRAGNGFYPAGNR